MSSATELEYFRGDSYATVFTLTDRSTKLPINLVGYTFVMTVDSLNSPETSSTTELFSVDGVITSAVEGTVSFTPTVINTAQPPGKYYYDVQMVLGSTKRTIIKDSFTITQDITKA